MMPRAIEVLIATSLYDFPSDRLCALLEERKVPFARINRETLAELRLSLDPVAAVLSCDAPHWRWEAGDKLRSIWWRQPTFLRNTPGVPLSLDEQLSRSQWTGFLRGLTALDGARWINHPAATYAAEAKPFQLRLAAKLGFSVPKTIVCNDCKSTAGVGDPFAMKSVDTVLLHDAEHQYFTYTNVVACASLDDAEFRAVPAICQEFLNPKLDLRVTVVGERIWCVAIHSGRGAITGDWRTQKRSDLSYVDFDLAPEIADRCVRMVEQLGLTYGAIDLAVSGDTVHFIEINPTGEWGWLDGPDRPIAKAIVDELCR